MPEPWEYKISAALAEIERLQALLRESADEDCPSCAGTGIDADQVCRCIMRDALIEQWVARNKRREQLLREAGEILTLLAVSGTSGEPISLGNDNPSLDQLCYLAARLRAEIDPPAPARER